MVGVRVRVALLEPPGNTDTTLFGVKTVVMPGGILSTLRVTLAPAPRELMQIIVLLPLGGIGGSQSGSALIVKATSAAVTWKGFMMEIGGSSGSLSFYASTWTSYQPEVVLALRPVMVKFSEEPVVFGDVSFCTWVAAFHVALSLMIDA